LVKTANGTFIPLINHERFIRAEQESIYDHTLFAKRFVAVFWNPLSKVTLAELTEIEIILIVTYDKLGDFAVTTAPP
jgi:hypothetical protein